MASKQYTNLILFTFFTSLSLFFFMIYYEKCVKNTLLEFVQIITTHPPYGYTSEMTWFNHISPKLSTEFISLCILHLLPLHLLGILTAISTIHLTSTLQTSHYDQPFTFTEVFTGSRLKGNFVTSILGLSLSSCALLGFIWLSIRSYATMTMFYIGYFNSYSMFLVFYCVTILVILVKLLELSVVWNMSLVISVLEGVDGMSAFSLAYCFNRGSERRGLFMMFVFFGLSLGLTVLCLFEGEDREVELVARTALLWVVHLVKWVACTWYYFGCKDRILHKKVDLEVSDAQQSLP